MLWIEPHDLTWLLKRTHTESERLKTALYCVYVVGLSHAATAAELHSEPHPCSRVAVTKAVGRFWHRVLTQQKTWREDDRAELRRILTPGGAEPDRELWSDAQALYESYRARCGGSPSAPVWDENGREVAARAPLVTVWHFYRLLQMRGIGGRRPVVVDKEKMAVT